MSEKNWKWTKINSDQDGCLYTSQWLSTSYKVTLASNSEDQMVSEGNQRVSAVTSSTKGQEGSTPFLQGSQLTWPLDMPAKEDARSLQTWRETITCHIRFTCVCGWNCVTPWNQNWQNNFEAMMMPVCGRRRIRYPVRMRSTTCRYCLSVMPPSGETFPSSSIILPPHLHWFKYTPQPLSIQTGVRESQSCLRIS